MATASTKANGRSVGNKPAANEKRVRWPCVLNVLLFNGASFISLLARLALSLQIVDLAKMDMVSDRDAINAVRRYISKQICCLG